MRKLLSILLAGALLWPVLWCAEAEAFEALFCHDKAKGQKYTLAPFFTDGCSSWMQGGGSIGLAKDTYYSHCCIVHDIAYWTGGTAAERQTADKGLETCVFQATRNRLTAKAMYLGVQPGGLQCVGTRWRWGYGWVVRQGARDYKSDRKAEPLTADESKQRRNLIGQAKTTARQRNAQIFDEWCAKAKKHGNKCDEGGEAKRNSQKVLEQLLGEIP